MLVNTVSLTLNITSILVFPSELVQAVLGEKDMTVEGAMEKTLQPLGRAGRDEEMGGTVL